MNPRLVQLAAIDVLDLEEFFETGNPGAGVRFQADFEDFLQRTAMNPRVYGRVLRSAAGREIREGMTQTFPVRVVYEVTATEVVILSVIPARARRHPWRRRLP